VALPAVALGVCGVQALTELWRAVVPGCWGRHAARPAAVLLDAGVHRVAAAGAAGERDDRPCVCGLHRVTAARGAQRAADGAKLHGGGRAVVQPGGGE
jgi:hypothetical protein